MDKRNEAMQAKYAKVKENETRAEAICCEDAEYLLVGFGSMSRIAEDAMHQLRTLGYKVGVFRPITLWPFPEKELREAAKHCKGITVCEMNAGQMINDVRLATNCDIPCEHFGRMGGIVPDPAEVVEAFKQAIQKK